MPLATQPINLRARRLHRGVLHAAAGASARAHVLHEHIFRSTLPIGRNARPVGRERMSIRLESVSMVSMGQSIISDVSLTVERGTMNVLLGPALAGKTTLMRLMAGLDAPTSGRILVDGKDVTGSPVRERSVAMVYQQFMNYPSLSVFENIASPLRVAKLKNDEIQERVQSVARLLGLQSLLDRLPHQLSGGQQQRTAIARAIVKRADSGSARRAARQSRLQAARGIARRASLHSQKVGCDTRLCDGGTPRSAAARRRHRGTVEGPNGPVWTDTAGLSASGADRSGARVLRSAAQRDRGDQAETACFVLLTI